jgi:tetratricopeptide (TPR) repeat protein
MSLQQESLITTEAETPKHPYESGLALYEQKGSLEEVIALFEQGLILSPKDATGYTCLSWLHLLRNQEEDADKGLNYAVKAVKLEPANYQAHFNLVLGMLVNSVSGVRPEFLKALDKCQTQEDLQEVIDNLTEAVERRPDYAEAQKVLNWIQERTK